MLVCLISSIVVYSQNNYSKGYSLGYKNGYCYNIGYGCLPPLSPIAPLPTYNESLNSYKDGYNRGFADGLQAQKLAIQSKNSTFSPSESSFGNVQPEFGQMNLYKPDYEFLNSIYQNAQNQYDKSQQRNYHNIRNNVQNFKNDASASLSIYKEYVNSNNTEIRKLRINNLISNYNSFSFYPNHIQNGIHKAKLIVRQKNTICEFYENCDVWVVNDTIVNLQYIHYLGTNSNLIMDGFFPSKFYYPSFQERITFGGITSGKSIVTTRLFNSAINQTQTYEYVVLFFDYIENFIRTQEIIKKVRNRIANKNLSNSTGWFKGYLSDRYILCDERDFYLENGIVKKWVGKNGHENIVFSGGKIMEGRTSVSLVYPPSYDNLPNSPLGRNSSRIYDIYFVDFKN